MEIKPVKIEDLGYSEFFATNRAKLGLEIFQIARVIAENRGVYKVKNADGESLAKITGKHIFNARSREDYPAIGDWVAISELEERKAIIQRILPRRTIMKRKHSGKNETQVIATNIDVAFIVESIDRDHSLNRIERYFAIASDGGIKSAIILNKIDMLSEEDLEKNISEIKSRFEDVDVFTTSALTDAGLAELKAYVEKGKTYCFLGSSGVGKSSLINKLIGFDDIKTREKSIRSDRGKHTTTAREMYFLKNGGIVIDNPGMREVGMTDTNTGINNLFDEISALANKCKFSDCTHIQEPGCAVLEAVRSGKLDKDKYSNYINLKKEAEYYEMTKVEKKEKSREFGKFIKKAKKDLKKFSHKNYGD